jgi:hypothetical protein
MGKDYNTSSRMIFVCELSFDDGGHVPFNAGLLTTISLAYPTERLVFFGAATHMAELRKELKPSLADSMTWIEIHPPTPGTSYFKRFVRELRVIWRLQQGSGDATSRLVFTSSYPSTVLALKAARLFRSERTPVQIVLHGMSGVTGKRYRNPFLRFQDMRSALSFLANTSIQYLVLEESIRKTVLQKLPFLSKNIQTFEHPITPTEGDTAGITLTKPIRFGFLGLADKSKGFPVFLDLAKYITAKHSRIVEFHVIGLLRENVTQMDGTEVLTTKPGTALMSRQKFVLGVKRLHFIVLPHEAASYTVTASGVVLDAITWKKPIVARRIPIFEQMFDKYGDIGYLFYDDKQLREILERILSEADELRYQRQVMNLQLLRKARDPEALAASYRTLCEKIV